MNEQEKVHIADSVAKRVMAEIKARGIEVVPGTLVMPEAMPAFNRFVDEIKRQQQTAAEKRQSFVYFIQAASGPIKIGIAKNPRRRLGEIQTSSHESLRLLALTPGTIATERKLHLRFANLRLNGEWFTPAAELIAFVDSLNGKTGG